MAVKKEKVVKEEKAEANPFDAPEEKKVRKAGTTGLLGSMLSSAEAAEYIGIGPVTLYNMRKRGEGPPFLQLTRSLVRYRKEDINAWIDQCIRQVGGQ